MYKKVTRDGSNLKFRRQTKLFSIYVKSKLETNNIRLQEIKKVFQKNLLGKKQ